MDPVEVVERELGVDRVPVDDRVGNDVQAVRLDRLALEGVQAHRDLVAMEKPVVQGVRTFSRDARTIDHGTADSRTSRSARA